MRPATIFARRPTRTTRYAGSYFSTVTRKYKLFNSKLSCSFGKPHRDGCSTPLAIFQGLILCRLKQITRTSSSSEGALLALDMLFLEASLFPTSTTFFPHMCRKTKGYPMSLSDVLHAVFPCKEPQYHLGRYEMTWDYLRSRW
jgi:hypothetical protein